MSGETTSSDLDAKRQSGEIFLNQESFRQAMELGEEKLKSCEWVVA